MKENQEKPLYRVAIVGNYGVGKSFIHSGIGGSYSQNSMLPSGNIVSTRGISMKQFNLGSNGVYEILDVAGFGVPVLKEEVERQIEALKGTNENAKQAVLINKKRNAEFVYRAVIRMTDVFMIVVNDLTSNLQELIEEIKVDIRGTGKRGAFYVIHNWKGVTNMEEYRQKIKNEAEMVYFGDNNSINGVVRYSEDDDHEFPVFHFFLANNNSKFGQQTNRKVFERIRLDIEAVPPKKCQPFLLRLQNATNSVLKDMVNNLDRKKPTSIIFRNSSFLKRLGKKTAWVFVVSREDREQKEMKMKKLEKLLRKKEALKRRILGEELWTRFRVIKPDGSLKINYRQNRKKNRTRFLNFNSSPTSVFGGFSGRSGNLNFPVGMFRRVMKKGNERLVIQMDVPGYSGKNKRKVKAFEDEVKVKVLFKEKGNRRYLEVTVTRVLARERLPANRVSDVILRGRGSGTTTREIDIPPGFSWEGCESYCQNGVYSIVLKRSMVAKGKELKVGKMNARFMEEFCESEEEEEEEGEGEVQKYMEREIENKKRYQVEVKYRKAMKKMKKGESMSVPNNMNLYPNVGDNQVRVPMAIGSVRREGVQHYSDFGDDLER